MHARPCMVVMPQLQLYEILYRAHDEAGHQGVGKVLSRLQERHTRPSMKLDVVETLQEDIRKQRITKFAEATPCAFDEYDAQKTAKIVVTWQDALW